jgi:hypothetical protein
MNEINPGDVVAVRSIMYPHLIIARVVKINPESEHPVGVNSFGRLYVLKWQEVEKIPDNFNHKPLGMSPCG